MKKLYYRSATSRSFAKLFSILPFAIVAFAALELLVVHQALAAGTKCCTTSAQTNCICRGTTTCPSSFPFKSTTSCNFKCCNSAGTSCTCLSSLSSGVCPSTFPNEGTTITNAARVCPLPSTTTSSGGSSGGTIGSTIECEVLSGTNTVDFTYVSQNADLACTLSPDSDRPGPATCQFAISYTRPAGLKESNSVQQCQDLQDGTSKLTDVALCSQVSGGNTNTKLVVAGELVCISTCSGPPPCNPGPFTIPVGIAGVSSGQCDTVFPAEGGLDAGQVLGVEVIFDGQTCNGPIKDFSVPIQARYCHGGVDGSAVDCIPAKGSLEGNHVGLTTVEAAIPFLLDFKSPANITCNPNSNDTWEFTIFGDGQLDPAQIDPSSVTVAPAAGGTLAEDASCPTDPVTGLPVVVNNSLTCTVPSCPLGDALASKANCQNGTVDVQVSGFLLSDTAIQGITTIQTQGQLPPCQ